MAAFRIRMTPAQREQAEWAVDPMADYADSPEDGAKEQLQTVTIRER